MGGGGESPLQVEINNISAVLLTSKPVTSLQIVLGWLNMTRLE